MRSQAHGIEASTHVGKNGVTPSLVEEVKRQLKDNKLVKVKLLKSAIEAVPREVLARELARETGAELIEVKGNTVVLFKR